MNSRVIKGKTLTLAPSGWTYNYIFVLWDYEFESMWYPSCAIICPADIEFTCGDISTTEGDGTINILDIIFLINYIFKDGREPYPITASDVNGDSETNILDIVYLLNFNYKEGPIPACPPVLKGGFIAVSGLFAGQQFPVIESVLKPWNKWIQQHPDSKFMK